MINLPLIGIMIGLTMIAYGVYGKYFKNRTNNIDEILKENLRPTVLSSEDIQIYVRRFYGGGRNVR